MSVLLGSGGVWKGEASDWPGNAVAAGPAAGVAVGGEGLLATAVGAASGGDV